MLNAEQIKSDIFRLNRKLLSTTILYLLMEIRGVIQVVNKTHDAQILADFIPLHMPDTP